VTLEQLDVMHDARQRRIAINRSGVSEGAPFVPALAVAAALWLEGELAGSAATTMRAVTRSTTSAMRYRAATDLILMAIHSAVTQAAILRFVSYGGD
jgi:hypothetical protein